VGADPVFVGDNCHFALFLWEQTLFLWDIDPVFVGADPVFVGDMRYNYLVFIKLR
jgi:hypothetical protein